MKNAISEITGPKYTYIFMVFDSQGPFQMDCPNYTFLNKFHYHTPALNNLSNINTSLLIMLFIKWKLDVLICIP